MTPLTLYPAEIPGVLSGRVTRIFRVLKPQPEGHLLGRFGITRFVSFREESGESRLHPLSLSPGEYWVRETWAKCEVTGDPKYKADWHQCTAFAVAGSGELLSAVSRWRSPVTMPRWASRASIRVADVRVHRAWDVNLEDLREAGASRGRDDMPPELRGEETRYSFAAIFNAINGPSAWEKNPWVVGAEIERIEE